MLKRLPRGTADFADFEQIKGVLAHAGLPEWETQITQILGVLAHADWKLGSLVTLRGYYRTGPEGQTFHG